MKKIGAVLFFALFSMIFSFSGFAFVIGDVNSDNKINLTEAINALQVTSGVRTAAAASATINVPADVPTIQQAIDAAKSGDIINVAAGTYTGALTINNKAVTIHGAGKTATTLSAASGADILTIDGCGCGVVVVSGVTLQGGQNGILARRGAVVEVTDVVVQSASAKGIVIDENATARLNNVTVQACGDNGIQASRNSSISFYGTIVSSNNLAADGTGDGIAIKESSSALFSSATVTAYGNGCRGISIRDNSALRSDGSSITVQYGGNCNNNGAGIHATNGSSINLQNSSSLLSDHNGYDGVRLGYNASFNLDSTCTMIVRNNGRRGLSIWGGADVELSGTVTVGANAEHGVDLQEGSHLMIYGGTTDIANNVDLGIRMLQSTLKVEGPGKLTVSGTTGAGDGIALQSQSSLWVSGSLVVQNNKGSQGSQGYGIGISNASQVTLYPQSPNTVVIRDNDFGIGAGDGSGITLGSSVTIMNNNNTKDIILAFGSRAALSTSIWGTIKCDETCIASGVTCPVP